MREVLGAARDRAEAQSTHHRQKPKTTAKGISFLVIFLLNYHRRTMLRRGTRQNRAGAIRLRRWSRVHHGDLAFITAIWHSSRRIGIHHDEEEAAV
jgi:hypothetical protein